MRTKKTLLNFITSFLPWIVLAALGFFRIKIFIDVYGSEMNGIIQLALQIFAYLSLMEIGFGAAINYKLYKPLAADDHKKVSELFCGAKKIFRRIGIFIFIGGVIVSIVAPLLIGYENFNYTHIFLIFILFSLDYFVQYFFGLSYRTLLIADQKQYKINLIVALKTLVFRFIEIYLILQGVNYIYVLTLSLVFTIISSIVIIKTSKKTYPWLNETAKKDTSALKMTKDVLVHRISGLVFNKTDIIVLSITQGLLVTSIYSVYYFVIGYLGQFISYIFNSSKDSFGNFFASSHTNENKNDIFYQLMILSVFLAGIIPGVFIISASSFVEIWIDKTYVLSYFIIILFGLNLLHSILIKPLHVVRNANGLYKETKGYTMVQAATNLILSIILAPTYGIAGVVFATVFSQTFIANPFEVRMVFKNILGIKIREYYKYYVFTFVFAVVLYFINLNIVDYFNFYEKMQLFSWVIETSIIFVLDCVVGFIIFYLRFKQFRNLLSRLKKSQKVKSVG